MSCDAKTVWTVAQMLDQPATVQATLINKMVQVNRSNDGPVVGLLHAFDTLSGCLVLIVFESIRPTAQSSAHPSIEIQLVPPHLIDQVSIRDGTPDPEQQFKIQQLFNRKNQSNSIAMTTDPTMSATDNQTESEQQIQERKGKIIQCLQQSMVPFKDLDDHLTIGSHFIIRKPYHQDNCECRNEIILKRTMDLIKNAF